MATNPNLIKTFNDIQVGRKFKTGANITYQKTSAKKAKPILKADGTAITRSLETTAFYNTKIRLILI